MSEQHPSAFLYVSYPWWARILIRVATRINVVVNGVVRPWARYTDHTGRRVRTPFQ